MSDLAYDIEQLWIEGNTPKQIAGILDCSIDDVYGWLESENLGRNVSYDGYSDDVYYGA
jgi:hypothetical protein